MLNVFSSIHKILKLIIFLTKIVDSSLGYDFYINLVLFFWGVGGGGNTFILIFYKSKILFMNVLLDKIYPKDTRYITKITVLRVCLTFFDPDRSQINKVYLK